MAGRDSAEKTWKKSFETYVREVSDVDLNMLLCVEVNGEPSILPEAEWLLSLFSERVRQAVLALCKRGERVTLKRLLQALYDEDKDELVEDICHKLPQMKISDDRKINSCSEEVPTGLISTLPVPHTAALEERDMLQPVEPKNSALKSNVHSPSTSKGMANPITKMACSTSESESVPERLLNGKSNPPPIGSNSIQMEDGGPKDSLAVHGETSSTKLSLESRMNDMTSEMKEVREDYKRVDTDLKDLKQKIENLTNELRTRRSEILDLKKKLKLETEQKQEVEKKLVMADASKDELEMLVDKLKRELRESNAEIQMLKRRKKARDSFEEVDHTGSHEEDEVGIACAEEHSPVSTWKFEDPLDTLGEGTYGIVYKAHCIKTGKELAVKFVSKLTKQAAEVLQKEVDQLSMLKPHKRVVTYFGSGYDDHPLFRQRSLVVITEFMPGGSLASCLEKRGPFSKVLTLRYTRQILEGVEYLHRCGVIHRDIKGSNIMRDTSGNLKLADFGTVKRICSEDVDKDESLCGTVPCGTAPWAAPEMLNGKHAVQTESDIWSVGATVVEMLTGDMPYKEENFQHNVTIIFKVGNYELNPLDSMKKGQLLPPADIESFLCKCFESEIKKRPSAKDLLADVLFHEQ